MTWSSALPRPSDSVLWTDELLGNGNGYVKTGPFKDWDTNVLMPLSDIPVKKLYRSDFNFPEVFPCCNTFTGNVVIGVHFKCSKSLVGASEQAE